MGCVLQHAQAASGTPSEREIRHSEPAWVPEDASTGWGSKAIDTCAATVGEEAVASAAEILARGPALFSAI